MRNKIRTIWLSATILTCFAMTAAASDEEAMRSLDEQVQEIKADVLDIASEIGALEERLLFPSNTQLAVFVSIQDADRMRLDSVELSIDGAPAAHYIYSFKELEALREGGVQRLYAGNVTRGSHSVQVQVKGKSPSGDTFARSEDFSFTKGIEPQMLGLTLSGNAANSIELADW